MIFSGREKWAGSLSSPIIFQTDSFHKRKLSKKKVSIFYYWAFFIFKSFYYIIESPQSCNSPCSKWKHQLYFNFTEYGRKPFVNSAIVTWNIVVRNREILIKVVWIEYYSRLNLASWRYKYPHHLRIHQM